MYVNAKLTKDDLCLWVSSKHFGLLSKEVGELPPQVVKPSLYFIVTAVGADVSPGNPSYAVDGYPACFKIKQRGRPFTLTVSALFNEDLVLVTEIKGGQHG